MKILRSNFVCLALPFSLSSSAWADPNWATNFEKAQAEAKSEHKFLLINFTGSDWCSWCKKLDAEVFSKPEFQQYAKDHLVLDVGRFSPRQAS